MSDRVVSLTSSSSATGNGLTAAVNSVKTHHSMSLSAPPSAAAIVDTAVISVPQKFSGVMSSTARLRQMKKKAWAQRTQATNRAGGHPPALLQGQTTCASRLLLAAHSEQPWTQLPQRGSP